jgi:GTP-binding protein HflX
MFQRALLITKACDRTEAKALIDCLGYQYVKIYEVKKRFRKDSRTYLTKGKLSEVKEIIENENIQRVYIYDDLLPRQSINLMKEFKTEVIDKIGLILEIFALHAGSKEAKLQIEMARLTHELPLIKEWIRRAKMKELPGFLGPGGYAIDAYYTHMKKRLAKIRRELNELRKRRSRERNRRFSVGLPQIAIAGYTNAGKTTLFNRLASERKAVGSEMFTTLSPKAKGVYFNGIKGILVDTVGFIKNIPTEVIEAFYATLEEIAVSNITLLVLDSSEDKTILKSKLEASLSILNKIGYIGKPIIVVLNKIDLASDNGSDAELIVKNIMSVEYPWDWRLIKVSALRGINLKGLKEVVSDYLREQLTESLRAENWAQTRTR